MREIRFRGKSLETGLWLFGDLLHAEGHCYIVNEEHSGEVDPKTVGQFTEMGDSNWLAIYEGDIIKDDKGVRVVTFEILEHAQGYDLEMYEDSGLEVIGNIHDNPELLKGGQDG